ncbi:MAG TPA: hypothetical protein VEU29_04110, partial [Actinomycetota bacterium]|nr:hypothetical protein [Actinomycetota bacterium]
MTEPGGEPRGPAPLTWSDVLAFLGRHKIVIAGILTPVIAAEVTNVVGPVVRWVVRAALLAIVIVALAILYIRRRGMWKRSRRRMEEFAERFRPLVDDEVQDDERTAPAGEPPGPGRDKARRRRVRNVAIAVL